MLNLYMAQDVRKGWPLDPLPRLESTWRGQAESRTQVAAVVSRLSGPTAGDPTGQNFKNLGCQVLSWFSPYTALIVLYLQMWLNGHFVNTELFLHKPEVNAYKFGEQLHEPPDNPCMYAQHPAKNVYRRCPTWLPTPINLYGLELAIYLAMFQEALS